MNPDRYISELELNLRIVTGMLESRDASSISQARISRVWELLAQSPISQERTVDNGKAKT